MIALIAGVCFLIYLNVPVVAIRIHGAPFLLGALVPALLAIPVAHRVFLRGENLRCPRVIFASLLMLALYALSAFFSVRPLESFDSLETWLMEGVLLAALIVNAVRDREEIRAVAYAVVAAGAVMGAIAVAQQVFGMTDHSFYGFGQFDDAVVDGQGRVAHRLAGPIGETNRFAQIMAVLIPIGAGIAITSAGKQRWIAWAAVFLITAGMAFSFSRGAIVALALTVPFALVYRVVRLRELVLVGLAGLVLLAAMPHYAERVASIGQVVVRTIGGLDPVGMRNADGAARGRLNEMQVAGMVFLDHPLLGVGPGLAPHHYGDYAAVAGGKVRTGTRRSHNLYLQLAAETGLIGISAFGLVIFLTMRSLD